MCVMLLSCEVAAEGCERAQQLKAPATTPDGRFDPQNPHGGRRELTHPGCPLALHVCHGETYAWVFYHK